MGSNAVYRKMSQIHLDETHRYEAPAVLLSCRLPHRRRTDGDYRLLGAAKP
jgi:hypothetical protein